jgi:hypothetical protein
LPWKKELGQLDTRRLRYGRFIDFEGACRHEVAFERNGYGHVVMSLGMGQGKRKWSQMVPHKVLSPGGLPGVVVGKLRRGHLEGLRMNQSLVTRPMRVRLPQFFFHWIEGLKLHK